VTPVSDLRAALQAAVAALASGGVRAAPTLERPKQADHGDYATNAALMLAPALKAAPRDVAERLGGVLHEQLGDTLDHVEVAGPGFLNLFLADAWYARALDWVLAAGDTFGAGTPATPVRVNLEFVSANPTGPMTAASARHAAYGDALARILEHAGHDVGREYYFNDAGTQIENLALSIRARARGVQPPEDGYQGDYIRDLAAEIPGAADMDLAELQHAGVEVMFARIKRTLHAYRVDYDVFFSERTLHEGSPSGIERAIAALEEQGRLYRSDGALWLRTTEFGDDKDRVLIRSTGQTTYFAADIAYAENKLARGFDKLILPLGADHHGYIGRMQAMMSAIGAEGRLEVPILQFVHLVEGSSRASMSKRRGDFVTLDDLIAQIGVDAARFFMLNRSHESTVDLDLDLAREQSSENPVYYVQYAHARIASVRRKAGEERVGAALAESTLPPDALHASERALVKKLLAFPDEVAEAGERRAPHRIAVYALELAQVFTAFYRDCQVVGAEPAALESWRLRLSVAAQRTLALALGLLGVTAPDEM
jgi:arginyl-tRNA synthetase